MFSGENQQEIGRFGTWGPTGPSIHVLSVSTVQAECSLADLCCLICLGNVLWRNYCQQCGLTFPKCQNLQTKMGSSPRSYLKLLNPWNWVSPLPHLAQKAWSIPEEPLVLGPCWRPKKLSVKTRAAATTAPVTTGFEVAIRAYELTNKT